MDVRGNELAIVMSGGGARGAYQVGLLQALAERRPDLGLDILTGVSAGAINAAHLANHEGSFAEATADLARLWCAIELDDVFRTDWGSLAKHVLRVTTQLGSGGRRLPGRSRGMVDTEPLRQFLRRALNADATSGELPGIARNLAAGHLRAVAVTSSSYSSGSSVTWVQGREIEPWWRAHRVGRSAQLTVEHIMASASLPLLFPAIPLSGEWHGDGAIRLSAPLSPAIHLGAQRLLVISTRHRPRLRELTPPPMVEGYPPPAQVAGSLLNAVFLDMLDGDALRLERINEMLALIPPDERGDLREVQVLLLRPSQDLGRLANDYEPRLPRGFRFLTRGLGTRETKSNDVLSLVMFQRDYLKRLIDLGRADAEERMDELLAFTAADEDASVR